MADGTALGTSIFDPVLMELVCNWFAPRPRKIRTRPVIIIDPFAGGCVRGIVAASLNLMYFGVDVSETQIAANREQWRNASRGVLGQARYPPTWIHGDGENIVSLVRNALIQKGHPPDTKADFLCTCPPYFNLEEYKAGPNDLSMMASYDAFLVKYRKILANATSLLRPNHLAVIVVGNVRSKTGALHHMLTDTTQAFKDCGCSLYNHAVLLTASSTAPMRAEKTMAAASGSSRRTRMSS